MKLDGVEGLKVTGPSKKFIFIPGGGLKWKNEWWHNFTDEPVGFYWSGERWTDVAAWDANGFYTDNKGFHAVCSHRIEGHMIRAIERKSFTLE